MIIFSEIKILVMVFHSDVIRGIGIGPSKYQNCYKFQTFLILKRIDTTESKKTDKTLGK